MFIICNDCKSLIVILYWKKDKGEEDKLYVSLKELQGAICRNIFPTAFFQDPYYYVPTRALGTLDNVLLARDNSIYYCDHLSNLCVKGDREDHFDPALYPNISY